MRVFYYKDSVGNFGDDLNEWLWDALWPEISQASDSCILVGIGTVIGLDMGAGHRTKLVLGSGVGYLDAPQVDDSWTFFAVRGPLTALSLGLPPDIAVTDSAALISRLPEYSAPQVSTDVVSFMPHLSSLSGNWEKVCGRLGIRYISPQSETREVLDHLKTSKIVLADAMHAAICADALRVPWIPLAISPHINTMKWIDWTQSLAVAYRPTYLPASGLIEWLVATLIRIMTIPYRLPLSDLEAFTATPEGHAEILRKHYGRRAALPRWRLKILQASEALLWRLLVPALNNWRRSPLNAVCGPIDRVMIANAARALSAAAAGPTSMSETPVFERAVGRLNAALERIKAHVAAH